MSILSHLGLVIKIHGIMGRLLLIAVFYGKLIADIYGKVVAVYTKSNLLHIWEI